MNANGHNGQVRIEGDWLVIERRGALARMSKGWTDKRLRIDQIAGIVFKPAGPLRNGYIHFATPGADPPMNVRSAGQDQNAVIFLRKQQPAFEAIRDAIYDTPGTASGE